ncbi:LytR/AlgR family response regulator transcription factor [Saccharicrinis fermentans]|uniref:Sensory transduction protein LytR n=1 Tax=Saccharicrinis fermentans DSM 9555 = JCM 21142 TaxID=869213 RepID=W7Y3C6_9BACT|nr:LytTR family DNA-binding domain-containing protein [Saccharicrinis fermentans]GAF02517.1 sensory transduction protein LytR [Saccharicrinis fermentans DSM 9555 = JCM 21142]
MIKVLIVEDEMPSARKLNAMLKYIAPDLEVVNILESVEQTVAFLKENQVDLIFLDIHLADGNSFLIFDQVSVETPIIFTTAFNQYAIDAFRQVSVDYLLKPIDKDRLELAMDKFRKYHLVKKGALSVDYQEINRMIAASVGRKEYQERFMVHYRDKIKTIGVIDIAAFYADNKSVFIVMFNGHSYDLPNTLEQLEEKLDPKFFFRANRKCIVHINAVKDAVVYSKSKLKLNVEPTLPFEVIISTEKSSKFKQWLNK